jgi:hypothetical protein
MSDIVQRLLKLAERERPYGSLPDTLEEAAAEIERLRAGLFDCMQEVSNHHRENEARAKIGGSDMAQRKAKAIVSRSGVLLHNIKLIARTALEGRT